MKSSVTPLRVCVSAAAALIRPHYVSLHSGVLRYVSTYLQRETFNSGSMGNPRSLMNNNNTHHCIGGERHCPSASIPQISVTMHTVSELMSESFIDKTVFISIIANVFHSFSHLTFSDCGLCGKIRRFVNLASAFTFQMKKKKKIQTNKY